ncbi:hypothetical protein Q8G35_24840 [Peribacillus simplex]|uniref:DUF4352 domain-containing protein n=2 Tax=Peribacillus TaxID=2675229 RepID=A0AA90P8D0_9BACI|nr:MULTISPECIES: hypothetical protein [Peribacillus]MDP1421509.1 hypothetical protein [Peribacillus simplex]MDP1454246.1 hypothetical protein [Peribacillus frigoritolerans]
MKKTLSIFFLILLLVGCSSNASPENNEKNTGNENQTENNANEKNDETKQQKNQEQTESIMDEYQPNPQVTDDRSLQKVGQTYTDQKGEATLKAIKNVNKTYEMGSIELTIREMKLIHLRPDYGMIDYFHVLTHDEEFDFVKVFVEIKNKSSEKVNFAPIALLETNTGETFDWQKEIYLEELNGEIEGNGTKFGNLGFIVNATGNHAHKEGHNESDNKEAKDIKWIEITTSNVFDKDQKKINEAQKIRIEF